MVYWHERALAIRVTAWAHIIANNLEVCVLDVTLSQFEHLQVQNSDRGEAPASHEDQIEDVQDVQSLGKIGHAINTPVPGSATLTSGLPQASPAPFPYEVETLGGVDGLVRFTIRDVVVVYLTLGCTVPDSIIIVEGATAFSPREKVRIVRYAIDD